MTSNIINSIRLGSKVKLRNGFVGYVVDYGLIDSEWICVSPISDNYDMGEWIVVDTISEIF